MDLPLAIALALVGALITLALCDLAGGIARAKGRSYWAFFAFGLLLWFPSLITALALPGPEPTTGPDAGRRERVLATSLVVLAAVVVAAGVAAAVAYAP